MESMQPSCQGNAAVSMRAREEPAGKIDWFCFAACNGLPTATHQQLRFVVCFAFEAGVQRSIHISHVYIFMYFSGYTAGSRHRTRLLTPKARVYGFVRHTQGKGKVDAIALRCLQYSFSLVLTLSVSVAQLWTSSLNK